jgi:glycolate oxidase subunit GlcD
LLIDHGKAAYMTLTAFEQALKTTHHDIVCLNSPAQRLAYERDANVLLALPPARVFIPETIEQVQRLVQLCAAHTIPFTTRGAGTGLAAGSVPHHESCVLISTARLKAMTGFSPKEAFIVVEAGVVNASLNAFLAPHGLMYAPDPSSQKACTLGGNWAANAGGVHCIGYGVTMDHILALEVITPEGERLWLHPPDAETSTPVFPMANAFQGLYTGSEGTLGIITRAKLRLLPVPAYTGVALLGFATVEAAMCAVSETISAGLTPKALEFMDAITVRCVNASFGVGLPEACEGVLLIELATHYPEELEYAYQQLQGLIQEWQPLYQAWETSPERRAALWQARKGAVASYGQISPMFYILDSVIPRNRLAEVLLEMQAISERYDLPIANVFHAGDGNLHPHLMFSSRDAATIARVKAAAGDIFTLCLSVGGVLSGEHGVGLEKLDHMDEQFDAPSLNAQEAVSKALDPKHLANPGKLVPRKSFCGESQECGHGATPHESVRGLSSQALTNQDLWI